DLKNGGSLYVKNVTGDIKITGWNKDKIEIDMVRKGRRDDIEVYIDRRGNRIDIEVDYPDRDYRDNWSGRNNSGSVHFNISVPVETELELKNATGDIIVSKINSRIEANTATGDVEIREIKGNVYGHTATGAVKLYDIDGEVDGHSATGRISIKNTGDVKAHCATGRIDILNTNGSDVDASVSTGDIEIELENVNERGRYDFSSSTGDVMLVIPANTKADITARAKPRNFSSDFDIFEDEDDRYRNRRSRYYNRNSRRTYHGVLNGGGARIDLSTSSGDLDIRKR
ncbi:DUF4097 family beta strand repeat-containing protein, partial [candidate division KSB1 bacterium]